MYICLCKGITDSHVRDLGRDGISPEALAATLGIDRDDCCGRCLNDIAELMTLAQSGCAKAPLTAAASAATPS